MSNKAITKNDLAAVLNEVLPPTPSEYRKLLWTNTQGAQTSYTVTANFSEYDEIEIVFDRVGDLITKRMGNSGSATFRIVWANYIVERTATISSNTMTIGNGGYYGSYNSGTLSAGSSYAVPTKIYGIKYERVNPPQAEIADVVVEQASTTVGSIHWTYRKWNSGVAECWGYSPATSVNCSTTYGYGYYAAAQTNQNYPTGLFIDVPRLIVVPISGDGVFIGVSATTKTGFAYYPYCNSSGAHYIQWDCHAIGWWK